MNPIKPGDDVTMVRDVKWKLIAGPSYTGPTPVYGEVYTCVQVLERYGKPALILAEFGKASFVLSSFRQVPKQTFDWRQHQHDRTRDLQPCG